MFLSVIHIHRTFIYLSRIISNVFFFCFNLNINFTLFTYDKFLYLCLLVLILILVLCLIFFTFFFSYVLLSFVIILCILFIDNLFLLRILDVICFFFVFIFFHIAKQIKCRMLSNWSKTHGKRREINSSSKLQCLLFLFAFYMHPYGSKIHSIFGC